MVSGNETQSPFASMLSRVTQENGSRLAVRTGRPAGPGWLSLDQLAAARPEHPREIIERAAISLETEDLRPAASFFLKSWCRNPVILAMACYIQEQRVPDISAGNVMARLGDSGFVEEISLVTGRSAALPSDPDAGHPETVLVDDQQELRSYLFDSLIHRHLEHLIEILRPVAPVGKRFMWATVADTCVGVLLLIGKHLGQVEHCRREAEAIAARPPLTGKTGVRAADLAGQPDLILRRGCCCFAYHSPQYGHCKTCPLLSETEQDRRLEEDLARPQSH